MIQESNVRLARTGRVFISADGEHLEPLGELKDTELSSSPDTESEFRAFFNKDCTLTLEGRLDIRTILFLRTGKKLFLKCPKKIRRSRKWRDYV